MKDVAAVEVWGTFRGNEWGNKGEAVKVQDVNGDGKVWGFEVRVGAGKEYFLERSGCEFPLWWIWIWMGLDANLVGIVSPLSLLKNPMILIAGVSMIIVFGMPYLMDNSTFPFPSCLFNFSLRMLIMLLQWILSSEPNLKSVKSHLLLVADNPRTHYKTSMLPLGWRVLVIREQRRLKVLRGWWQRRGELRDKRTWPSEKMTGTSCRILPERDRRIQQAQITIWQMPIRARPLCF